MGDAHYRMLVRAAVVLTAVWIGWTFYDSGPGESTVTGRELAAADRYLEDGAFEQALGIFSQVYARQPDNLGALRGKAQALMRIGIRRAADAERLDPTTQQAEIARLRQESTTQLRQALGYYDEAVERELTAGVNERNRRALGVALANRGILKDQLGEYRGALADYREGLRLEPGLAEGPGFLTRFLRNQPQPPPSIADRARYLAAQLAKPEAERLMRIPEQDHRQRAYRFE
ncbi:tetratricopeptide repeat protein [Sedimenticola hydrogenitrophicus]|uniref:tetratricopeptide repeat protein n=1 Tax=Sedimenticola hydrogenitrophicus TaxID=2967975 RepID=UPI0023B039FE|nr:tetratricopeptide repeat protein [Sedimenticola hydrogenitrophicus]